MKQRHKQLQKKKYHPERAENAKSRVPASENAIRLFCKDQKTSKCIFLRFKKEKNAFRLHEEQNSNVTNDNFGDGETAVLRCIHIYLDLPSLLKYLPPQ